MSEPLQPTPPVFELTLSGDPGGRVPTIAFRGELGAVKQTSTVPDGSALPTSLNRRRRRAFHYQVLVNLDRLLDWAKQAQHGVAAHAYVSSGSVQIKLAYGVTVLVQPGDFLLFDPTSPQGWRAVNEMEFRHDRTHCRTAITGRGRDSRDVGRGGGSGVRPRRCAMRSVEVSAMVWDGTDGQAQETVAWVAGDGSEPAQHGLTHILIEQRPARRAWLKPGMVLVRFASAGWTSYSPQRFTAEFQLLPTKSLSAGWRASDGERAPAATSTTSGVCTPSALEQVDVLADSEPNEVFGRCLGVGGAFLPVRFILWPPDPPLSTLTAGFLLAAYILALLGVALEAVVVSQLWPMTGPAPEPAEPRR